MQNHEENIWKRHICIIGAYISMFFMIYFDLFNVLTFTNNQSSSFSLNKTLNHLTLENKNIL